MTLLNSGDLAKALNVSKGRVSQYVSEGKLLGCFTGDGRARRFDLGKAAAALGRQLHPGQMLGNGADTRKALAAIRTPPAKGTVAEPAADEDDDEDPPPPVRIKAAPPARDGSPLDGRDPDRYELARTQKAEEEARRLRRLNAEAEGSFVLASEVERQVARMMAQELAEFEAVLRDGSRRVADRLGVEFKAVRQVMMDQWRSHRATRTQALTAQAEAAELSPNEIAENI